MSAAIADPRIVRSRAGFQQALLRLMPAQSYADLSVVDIAREAGLSRPTFYAHFAGKDELLGSILDDAFELFMTDLSEDAFAQSIHNSELIMKVLESWRANADFIKIVVAAGPSQVVFQCFRSYAARMHALTQDNATLDETDYLITYGIDFIAASSLAFLHRWCHRDFVDDPVQLAQVFLTLVAPGAEALRQASSANR